MIVTAKSHISTLWQVSIATPWAIMRWKNAVMGAVFVFSLKKFIENPAGITFILSLPLLLAILVSPICSFISDRIRTRYGRRKPFVIPSLIGVTASFIAMPLMPSFYGLVAAYLVFHISNEFGDGATDTLKQEVVPPAQRTAAAAIGTWIGNITNILYYICAIGRFDDFQYYAGFPISGEESIYWGIGAMMLTLALFLALGVKETPQASKFLGERLTPKNFFGGLLDRNLWPVYLLITGWAVSNAGLGSLGALLYTEQWGFTKQEMGLNVAIGGVLNIFIIAIIGLFAYKLPRMRTFKVLLLLMIFVELFYYIYVEFILFDKTPTLAEIIFFGEVSTIVGVLLGLVYGPLVYDYVPRNEMGTFAAGSSLVGRAVSVLTLNGVGVFVSMYAVLFMPPGGDMTRVALEHSRTETEVRQALTALAPEAPSGTLSVEAWYATNAALNEGRAFEIRRKNDEANALRKQRDTVNARLTALLARKANAGAMADRAGLAGDEASAARHRAEEEALAAQAAPYQEEVNSLDARLLASATAFAADVRSALAPMLMPEGGGISSVSVVPARVVRFPLARRPDLRADAHTLDALRLIRPDVIDVRVVFEGDRFFLDVSTEGTAPANDDLPKALAEAARGRLSEDILRSPPIPEREVVADAIDMEAIVVEDPLNSRISPITSVIYFFWDWFGTIPQPERRMAATGRALREADPKRHARVTNASAGTDHRIRIVAIPASVGDPPAAPTDASLAGKLADLPPELAAAAAQLAQKLVPAAGQNRITVARADLAARFAPPKFDYMSGYLWMILMSTVGLCICLLFTRREKKGLIRPRGKEEAEAQSALEAKNTAAGLSSESFISYTPGYVPQKVAMLAFGALLIGFGFLQLAPDLALVFGGGRAQALASHVVKERPGSTPQTLNSDAEILQARERHDRSYVFWNNYSFTTDDGQNVTFQARSGMQLRPAFPLRDAEGLPTTVTIFYDRANPKNAILPFEMSTWFVPGIIAAAGFLTVTFAALLLLYARKPIQMPRLDDAAQGSP